VEEKTQSQMETPKNNIRFISIAGFLSTLLIAFLVLVYINPLIRDEEGGSVMPPSPSDQTSFVCPETEWVDCMPGPDMPKPWCEPDYLEWASDNCPGFQGAAY
jgi:hypothetical protein